MHGHTRLEVIWTVIPVLILAVIAVVVFVQLPKITRRAGIDEPDPHHGRGAPVLLAVRLPERRRASINTLYVPVGAVVDLKVVATDVIHSWWIPALGGKIQAIPGRVNHTWFMAEKAGTYEGQCAELCGVYHASMTARVVVESQAEYDAYVGRRPRRRSASRSGKASARRATATSARAATARTSRATRSSSRSPGCANSSGTASPARSARCRPVGDTWNTAQIKALVDVHEEEHLQGPPVGATP